MEKTTEIIGAFKMLKENKRFLSKQEYSTIRGQIIAGQSEAAMKGLNKLLKRKGQIINE